MIYQNPPAPTLPPQPTPPLGASHRRGLLLSIVVLVTLALIAAVVSTVPSALTKARSAAYPKPELGPISETSPGGSESFQENEAVQFSVEVVAGHDLSYQWDFGDGSTSTDSSPTHVYSQYNQSIQVTVEVTDPLQQTASQSNTIAVLPTPPTLDSLNATEDSFDSCYVTASVNATSDAPLSFQWNWGDGTGDSTDAPEDYHYYNFTGNIVSYTISVTATDPYNQTATTSQTISINC